MARKTSGLQIEGLEELRDTFRRVAPAEAEKAADDTVLSVAKYVEARLFRRLQNFARTGRLMHSIFSRRRKAQYGVHVAEVRGGATAPYLLMQEFGTSKTDAQPSIGPAVEDVRPDLPAIYREEFAANFAKRLKRKK